MLKAVIIDDEEKAIQSLSWELTNFSNQIEIMETFTDPEAALGYLQDHEPDCVFLDIQMPTMDGFQFLERLGDKDYAVVITTAYNEYAIKALKHQAQDYLLKPIDTDDLKDTIDRVRKYNSKFTSSEKLERVLRDFNEKHNHRKITINTDGKMIFLPSEDIVFVESDGNYSTIYLTGNHKKVVTKKLKEIDELLPTSSFFRIHNSYIINLNKIKEFLKTEGYVVMQSNHRIPVARQRKSDFLGKFE